MRTVLLAVLALLCCAAVWEITEQSPTRIVMELVKEPSEPEPTPEPVPVPVPDPVIGDSEHWIMGYYVGYQQELYPPEKVDFNSITHLMVGRVLPNADGSLLTHLDIDNTKGPALAKTLSGLAHQNSRKAILMIGGDGTRNGWVSATKHNRAAFVNNLIQLLDEWKYDGLDLDWEPILTEDKPLLLALIKDLRAKRKDMILTIPVGWINGNFGADPWYAQIAPYLDRINVMSYLMGGAWDGWLSWHSTALTGHAGRHPSSLQVSSEKYMEIGIPANKLGLGIGFFGVCWKGITEPRQEVSGASIAASDNTMSYRNIISYYFLESGYRWDDAAGVPYLSYPNGHGTLGCQFISSEDPRSAELKGKFISDNGLGGMIIWTVNQGYIPEIDQNPLLTALAKGMFSTGSTTPAPEPTPEPIPVPSSELGGDIYGNLPKAIYAVVGDLRVPNGKILTLAPGTTLMFKGHYKMQVEGILKSVGTKELPIVYTAENKEEGWFGLRWGSYQNADSHDTNGMNEIKYSIFEYGIKEKSNSPGYSNNRAGALFVYGVENIAIENNVFRYNRSWDKCGAVMLLAVDADISFKHNVFIGNESSNLGGAICFTHGHTKHVYGGKFENNKGSNYGGIYVFDTRVHLYGVGFSGNIPNNGGGNITVVE